MKPSQALAHFRSQVTEAGFSPVYQAQQRTWNERYNIHEQNAKRWRLTAFGCIGLAAIAISMLGYDDSLSKYVPYIVERDHLGDGMPIGAAERTYPLDPRVIQTEINRWIRDVRTTSVDAQNEKTLAWEAYHHTNKHGPASGQLDDWFKTHDPFARAQNEIVTVTTISTLPIDPTNWKTWTAKWKEDVRTRNGSLVSSENKEMTIVVSHIQPKTDEEFKNNSSGIFVDSFDWTK